jgi:hypothetical protein|mmetsp:Transcript_53289/g.157634  ORF Transcript_53289/g.157634 Transcript_53289/m.157634 type:complete len:113 (-) Transcript_53289:127-465(-)
MPRAVGRFWGSQCLHYTVPNETGVCRVSFDFRVIPRSCFVEQFSGGNRPDGRLLFDIGGFFGWLDAEGNEVSALAHAAAQPADEGGSSPETGAATEHWGPEEGTADGWTLFD